MLLLIHAGAVLSDTFYPTILFSNFVANVRLNYKELIMFSNHLWQRSSITNPFPIYPSSLQYLSLSLKNVCMHSSFQFTITITIDETKNEPLAYLSSHPKACKFPTLIVTLSWNMNIWSWHMLVSHVESMRYNLRKYIIPFKVFHLWR